MDYSCQNFAGGETHMKREKVIACLLIYALSLTILGGTIVFAPNPNPGNPFVPLDVLITNTDPIQVTIDSTENVNVEIPDGVEVTNTVTVDGTVEVDDSDPIDVEVPDGVKITNPEDITLDLTGWLHTTQQGSQVWNQGYGPGAFFSQMVIDTEGYREITVVFDSSISSVDFEISWELSDTYWYYAEQWTYSDEKTSTDTRYFFKTYDIQGQTLRIDFKTDDLSNGQVVSIDYYLTT